MPKPRKPGDPWHTVFYRDPHALWWAPAVVVAITLLVVNLLLFDRSLVHAVTVAALFGGTGGLATYYRLRSRTRSGES